ncbi:hypothetical protein chiPu_0004296 [Chiloscyllium punctatum]|uniref:NAD(+) hydrolase SARM1 n=1 Tax=Chiloscyllium punctatum TaxID=137246 RepID=A0A401S664_CHIPU|nr:hypothetical protein [Chiloscyllium punctatum]
MLDVRMCPIRVEIRTMIKARTSTCLKSTGMNKTIAANNGNPKLAVCVNESQPENVQADYSDLTEGPSGKQASSSVDSPSQLRSSKAPMSIYISYSPDASFLERKFICETVRQLKQTNFREETWFDKDEVDITFPFWLSQRLEAIEKCKGAIIFLSKSYFKCPISLMEGKILLERLRSSEKTVKIFPVLQNDVKVPQGLAQLLDGVMDLTGARIARNTLAEKSSLVIGNLSEKMKECALIKVPFQNLTTPILEFSKGFMVKKLYSWTVGDVQEWLCHLGIREVYRQTFAEYMVDGFLLLSVTDEDLSQYLGNVCALTG